MQKASFAERIEFEKNNYVMTYYAQNAFGKDFFCYILCGLDGYKKMLADQEAKPFVKPEIYGEVIYKDFIAEPDAKAKEFLNKWLAENNGSLTS